MKKALFLLVIMCIALIPAVQANHEYSAYNKYQNWYTGRAKISYPDSYSFYGTTYQTFQPERHITQKNVVRDNFGQRYGVYGANQGYYGQRYYGGNYGYAKYSKYPQRYIGGYYSYDRYSRYGVSYKSNYNSQNRYSYGYNNNRYLNTNIARNYGVPCRSNYYYDGGYRVRSKFCSY